MIASITPPRNRVWGKMSICKLLRLTGYHAHHKICDCSYHLGSSEPIQTPTLLRQALPKGVNAIGLSGGAWHPDSFMEGDE